MSGVRWTIYTPPVLFAPGVAQREAHEQRHRPAGRALFAAALPGGAGDVEMRPALLAREAREEGRRRDAAARAAADVGEVREIGAQLLLVFLPQRHLPDAVPGFLGRRAQLIRELLVVGEEAGGDVAERDDARAGERRDVDQRVGLEALGVGEGIAEDEPAL